MANSLTPFAARLGFFNGRLIIALASSSIVNKVFRIIPKRVYLTVLSISKSSWATRGNEKKSAATNGAQRFVIILCIIRLLVAVNIITPK